MRYRIQDILKNLSLLVRRWEVGKYVHPGPLSQWAQLGIPYVGFAHRMQDERMQMGNAREAPSN